MPAPNSTRPRQTLLELDPPECPKNPMPDGKHEYDPNSVELGDSDVLLFTCRHCGRDGSVEIPFDAADWGDDE